MLFVPWIFAVPKKVIIRIDGLAPLGDVRSSKWDQTHFSNHIDKMTILFSDWIDLRDEPHMSLSISHDYCLFHARGHSIERRVALLSLHSGLPTFFFVLIGFSLIIAFSRLLQCFLKHLIKQVVVL